MSFSLKHATLILFSAALLVGCASVEPRKPFAAVESALSQRLPQRVQWNRNTASDQAATAAVNELLARPLAVEGAVQIALLNNRNLQAAYENLGIAQADLVQAGLLKNPVLDGDVKFPEGGGGTKLELVVLFDFLDVLYIPLRKSLAETALEGAKLEVTGAVVDVAAQTRAAFLRAQAAEQMLEMRRNVLLAAEASYDLARRINEAGNNRRLDLANERAFYEEAKLEVAASETEAAELQEELAVLMGFWAQGTHYTIGARLTELPVDPTVPSNLVRQAIANSIDLKRARGDVELAAKQLGITKPLGLLSELELGVAFERESGGGHEIGPAFALPLPIFSQGQPAVAAAEARLRQAMQRHYALAVQVRSAARSADTRLTAARQRVEYFHRVVLPLRHTIVQETQKQYNGMFVGAFELLQAKQAEIEAGRKYIEALRDFWLAQAGVDQLLAGRLPRGISSSLDRSESLPSPLDRGGH